VRAAGGKSLLLGPSGVAQGFALSSANPPGL
jgi:hypothetical protein